jgi:stage V sporulation protein G
MEQKSPIKVDRMHKLAGDGPTKAFCDITLFNAFTAKGLRVINGKEGLFLSMPREQGRDGKWYDIFHPISSELRKELQKLILEHYNGMQ